MRVEVVYATPERQYSQVLDLAEGARIEDALAAADLPDELADELADVDWRSHPVGVFGERAELAQTLKAGDRVEIYRPLEMDAKSARRRRAEEQAGKSEG